MVNNPPWLEIAKILPGWIALLFSFASLLVAGWSLKITRDKEKRLRPSIGFYLSQGVLEVGRDGSRSYRFAISVSNRSDNPTSIANLEGILRGVTKEGVEISIRVPVCQSAESPAEGLVPGARLDAWATLVGHCEFLASAQLIERINNLRPMRLCVTDSAGGEHFLHPGPLNEIRK